MEAAGLRAQRVGNNEIRGRAQCHPPHRDFLILRPRWKADWLPRPRPRRARARGEKHCRLHLASRRRQTDRRPVGRRPQPQQQQRRNKTQLRRGHRDPKFHVRRRPAVARASRRLGYSLVLRTPETRPTTPSPPTGARATPQADRPATLTAKRTPNGPPPTPRPTPLPTTISTASPTPSNTPSAARTSPTTVDVFPPSPSPPTPSAARLTPSSPSPSAARSAPTAPPSLWSGPSRGSRLVGYHRRPRQQHRPRRWHRHRSLALSHQHQRRPLLRPRENHPSLTSCRNWHAAPLHRSRKTPISRSPRSSEKSFRKGSSGGRWIRRRARRRLPAVEPPGTLPAP